MNDLPVTLGGLLRAHRLACGLTQAAVAEQLLVSVRTVKAWESDTTKPRPRRLEYLLTYLEVPVREGIQAKRLALGMSLTKPLATHTRFSVQSIFTGE